MIHVSVLSWVLTFFDNMKLASSEVLSYIDAQSF
jgi:hypothetical protein